jgi:peptide/nickel transport system substrate-binding protein
MLRRDMLGFAGASLAGAGVAAIPLRIVQAQGGNPALLWGGSMSRTLDPHTVLDAPSGLTRSNLYDTLYVYGGTPVEPRPVLVKEMRASADGMVFDFMLHEGVRFHDGSEMTAEDVVYSFRRLLALRRGIAPAFQGVLVADKVTATARHAVRMTLDQPFSPLFSCLPLVAIMNKRLMEAHTANNDWGEAWIAGTDAGSGPYRVVPGSFRPLQALDLEAFPEYWRGWPHQRPIRQVICRPVADDATRILAVERGDIDTTTGYVRPDVHDRLRRAPGVTLTEEPQLRTFLFRMHNGRAPFNNLDYRKAISCAFPYDVFIDRMLRGTAERNPGPLPLTLWGSPAGLEGYRHDLDAARRHLDAARRAGAPVDREITFTSLVGFDETDQAAQLLQAQLRRLGISMRINRALWANAVQMTQSEDTSPDIWAHWASTYYIDPDNWTGTFYMRAALGSQRGSSWYRDDETDALLHRARTTLDRAERQRLYEAASRRLVDHAVDVWIYNSRAYRAVRSRIRGYQPGYTGDDVDLRNLWIEA